MTAYRKFLRIRCVKVVIAIIGNCYTGWGGASVSEGGCFATVDYIHIPVITPKKITLQVSNSPRKSVGYCVGKIVLPCPSSGEEAIVLFIQSD